MWFAAAASAVETITLAAFLRFGARPDPNKTRLTKSIAVEGSNPRGANGQPPNPPKVPMRSLADRPAARHPQDVELPAVAARMARAEPFTRLAKADQAAIEIHARRLRGVEWMRKSTPAQALELYIELLNREYAARRKPGAVAGRVATRADELRQRFGWSLMTLKRARRLLAEAGLVTTTRYGGWQNNRPSRVGSYQTLRTQTDTLRDPAGSLRSPRILISYQKNKEQERCAPRTLTRHEREHARRVLRNRMGYCYHDRRCATHEDCLRMIGEEISAKSRYDGEKGQRGQPGVSQWA